MLRTTIALLTSFITAPALATTWHKIGSVDGFPGMKREIQSLVDEGGMVRINHICVVVADYRDLPPDKRPTNRLAYVIWSEGHAVLAYTPTAERQIDGASNWGAASFDLESEVYPDWKDVKGVRGVSRAFANAIVRACRSHGDRFVMVRHG